MKDTTDDMSENAINIYKLFTIWHIDSVFMNSDIKKWAGFKLWNKSASFWFNDADW